MQSSSMPKSFVVVCGVVAAASAFSVDAHATYTCQTVPGSISNAAQGDLVFRQSTDTDLVTTILHALNQTRTHVGMDAGGTVYHNTRDMSVSQATAHCVGGTVGFLGGMAGCANAHLDGPWLQNGGPNDGLQVANDGDFATGYTTTLIKTVNPTAGAAAVAWLSSMRSSGGIRYSLYAYSQEASAFAGGGNMCAGTMLEALTRTASTSLQNNWWTYDPYWRANRAGPIATLVENFVNGQTFAGFGMDGYGVAGQVVNTFAFNNAIDRNWGWYPSGTYHNVGSGSTISPDDLVTELSWGWDSNYQRAEQPAYATPTQRVCSGTLTCSGGTHDCGDGFCAKVCP